MEGAVRVVQDQTFIIIQNMHMRLVRTVSPPLKHQQVSNAPSNLLVRVQDVITKEEFEVLVGFLFPAPHGPQPSV